MATIGTSSNPLAGYTVIKPAATQMAEAVNTGQITSFQVVDVKTGIRETVDLKKGGKKAAPRKTKKNVVASSVMDTVEMSADERKELGLDPLPVEPEDSQEEQEEPHPEIEIFEKKPWAPPITKYPQEDIVFVTPYTEITVAAYEVYIDATCFTMVTPRNDRVKMKPKKGATFEAVYKDTMYNLYASGIYIPITSIASILSIFFVIPDNQGAEE